MSYDGVGAIVKTQDADALIHHYEVEANRWKGEVDETRKTAESALAYWLSIKKMITTQ